MKTQDLKDQAYLSRFGREDTADTLALRDRLTPVLPAPETGCPDHAAIAADAGERKSLIAELRQLDNPRTELSWLEREANDKRIKAICDTLGVEFAEDALTDSNQ